MGSSPVYFEVTNEHMEVFEADPESDEPANDEHADDVRGDIPGRRTSFDGVDPEKILDPSLFKSGEMSCPSWPLTLISTGDDDWRLAK